MYGNKKRFRLISSILSALISASVLIDAIVLMTLHINSLDNNYGASGLLKLLYIMEIYYALMTLIFSALLFFNKAPKAMAIAIGIFTFYAALICGTLSPLGLKYILYAIFYFALLISLFIYMSARDIVPLRQIKIQDSFAPDSAAYAEPHDIMPFGDLPKSTHPTAILVADLDRQRAEGIITDEEYKTLLLIELEKKE